MPELNTMSDYVVAACAALSLLLSLLYLIVPVVRLVWHALRSHPATPSRVDESPGQESLEEFEVDWEAVRKGRIANGFTERPGRVFVGPGAS